jgi:hypothetical protein
MERLIPGLLVFYGPWTGGDLNEQPKIASGRHYRIGMFALVRNADPGYIRQTLLIVNTKFIFQYNARQEID